MSRKWVDRELLEDRLHDICNNICQYPKKDSRRNVMCPSCWLGDIFDLIDELAVEKEMTVQPLQVATVTFNKAETIINKKEAEVLQ